MVLGFRFLGFDLYSFGILVLGFSFRVLVCCKVPKIALFTPDLHPITMRTQDFEICGDSFVLENARNEPKNPKKWVGRYCGTYTGKVTEIPIFTLHLHHSETSGVAAGGKRRPLAVYIYIYISIYIYKY